MRKTRTTYVPVNTEDANTGNPLYYKKNIVQSGLPVVLYFLVSNL